MTQVKRNKIKVLIAMSGGVDSSVAAALLKERGYSASGVTMQIWDGGGPAKEGLRHGCYGPGEIEDIEDVQRVCWVLGIDFHVLDLRQEYKAEVLDYLCHEYLSGRTPNPCLRCNHKVKFDAMLVKAFESGIEFDLFATGHYARVEYDSGKNRYLLKKAKDLRKDQSYFLAFLSQVQLSHSLFPIGDFTKQEVREMAAGFGLPVADKLESQDFNMTGSPALTETASAGPILDRQGNTLGRHRGIQFYTIGQRKGLGISAREPLYVTKINAEENAITIDSKESLYQDELVASELNWIAIEELKQPMEVRAKIRSLHDEAEALIIPEGNYVYVKFKEPQMAIAPGQAIVFYDGDTVIGGGTINKTRMGKDGEGNREGYSTTAYRRR